MKLFWKRRLVYVSVVVQVVGMIGLIVPKVAEAGTLANRSLSLSNATVSQTGVTYTFTVTPTAQSGIGAIGIKFCNEDPLQGTTCTTPTGMVTTAAGNTVQSGAGFGSTGTWSPAQSVNGQPYFTNSTTQSTTATASTITISNTTNPSSIPAQSYYAKVWTCTGSSLCADSAAADFGGLAWDVSQGITVSAKVQESLTMCVYSTGASCASPGALTANLGTLNTTQTSAASSKFDVATNAANGLVVQYFGPGLASGTNYMTAAGTSYAVASANNAASVERFGINLASTNSNFKTPAGGTYSDSAAPTGTAPIAAVASAFSTGNTISYINNTNQGTTSFPAGATPASPGNQGVATASGPVNTTTFTVNYAASINSLTKPGVYTTTVQYLATGVF